MIMVRVWVRVLLPTRHTCLGVRVRIGVRIRVRVRVWVRVRIRVSVRVRVLAFDLNLYVPLSKLVC